MQRVTVIGAGTMGHGIARVSALAGYEVHLVDVDPAVVDKALGTIRRNLEKGVSRGKVSAEAMEGGALGARGRR